MGKPTEVNKLNRLKDGTLTKVENSILDLVENRGLEFPDSYSPINALKAGWLEIQELEYNGKPAVESCSKVSIINALLDMVTDALTPARDQGYFIPKSGRVGWWRSYYGYEAIARRVAPVADIYKNIVWKGDKIKIEYRGGQHGVVNHQTDPDNWSNDESDIRMAYAVLVYSDGRPSRYEIMNMDQIKASWKQGDLDGEGPAHNNFPGQMAKRTVVKRLLNPIINAGDDSHLVGSELNYSRIKRDIAVEESEEEYIDTEVEETGQLSKGEERPEEKDQSKDKSKDNGQGESKGNGQNNRGTTQGKQKKLMSEEPDRINPNAPF